jgi:hypothetical protein
VRRSAVTLAAAVVLLAASPAPAREYSFVPAPYSAVPRFAVHYAGSGTWRTDFHATPPNPGGGPDTNEAHDSSAQSWRLRFDTPLVAGGPARETLAAARGTTRVVGRVDHTHVDGLYRELDSSVACVVKGGTRRTGSAAALTIERPAGGGVVLTAGDPLTTALANMPQACPRQGDSIDRILDNYFTPGFSFALGYGPDPWFASRAVAIPARVMHRSARVAISLRPTPVGRPPAGCAVAHPDYETCATHGTWNGVLTLVRAG